MDDETHEWVSFEHDGETWLFDVTFLTSNWHCIWDSGCLGVHSTPTPERAEGCCTFGAHFSDDADRERVTDAAARLEPEDWQHHGSGDFVTSEVEGDCHTAIVDDACVFLNRPGFPGGHGCALHRAALRHGEPITDWKPEVCWQLPLRLEYHEDDNGHIVNVLRQWRHRDWGEAGAEFAWWCTEDPLAFTGHEPVHRHLDSEIRALVGDTLTERLATYLATRFPSVPPEPARPVPVALSGPAVRS